MSAIPQGAIRFNTDSQKLEFYAQGEWWNMVTDTPNLGVGADTTAGARGFIGGGGAPGTPFAGTDSIEYFNIASMGSVASFGTLSASGAVQLLSSFSSSTRGMYAGGRQIDGTNNTLQFITLASTGNATDHSDLENKREYHGCCSNSTRGLIGGGNIGTAPTQPATTNIEYVTIASSASSKTFGNLTRVMEGGGATSSSTRGIFAGGYSPSQSNIIDFVTIATLGDAHDFGDLTRVSIGVYGCSNATRSVICQGYSSSANINNIDYITIATTGNAVDFGDRTVIGRYGGAASSSTRAVFAGGYASPVASYENTVDYVEIPTQGNAVDFGDLSTPRGTTTGFSNAHGGL